MNNAFAFGSGIPFTWNDFRKANRNLRRSYMQQVFRLPVPISLAAHTLNSEYSCRLQLLESAKPPALRIIKR